MEFDKIHFQLNDSLRPRRRFPRDWVSRIKWATPEPLYMLCSHVVNYLPEEPAFKWNNMHVLQWIERLGFPQYRNTFYVNMINGRTLLLLDATALCLMNIKDFEHITTITKAIRDLYKVELILFQRSISLPPRLPDTHFKLFRVCTGPTYQRIKRTELWRRMHLLQEPPPQRSHWNKLHEWLQHEQQMQRHRIGYAYTQKLYKVKRDLRPPVASDSNLELNVQPCECIPPCECAWQPGYYREPWTLQCLLGDQAREVTFADGDIVVAVVPGGDSPEKEAADPAAEPCSCMLQYECQRRRSGAPVVLSVIRSFERLIDEVNFVHADLGSESETEK